MAIVIQLPDVASAGDFGPIALPSLAKCRAYHLLGGSQADSVANRAVADQPLVVAGVPTYEPDCAVLSSAAGFIRPVAGSQYDRTVVVVFADPYQAPAGAPAEPLTLAISPLPSALCEPCRFSTGGVLRDDVLPSGTVRLT